MPNLSVEHTSGGDDDDDGDVKLTAIFMCVCAWAPRSQAESSSVITSSAGGTGVVSNASVARIGGADLARAGLGSLLGNSGVCTLSTK